MTLRYKKLDLSATQIKLAPSQNTFTGYASTFGNIDAHGDTIVKGAYLETLAQNGLPKMFFNHDMYQVPVGKWVDAKEDDHGLLLTGEFTPGNTLANEVKSAMLHGTVDGLSIGYRLEVGDYEETSDGRTIRKVDRLVETSIVTMPADKFARIDLSSVKNLDFDAELLECKTERDIERLLRDAGLSKKGATAVVSRAKAIFQGRDASDAANTIKTQLILERLQKLAA